jgi:hypothetical protein
MRGESALRSTRSNAEIASAAGEAGVEVDAGRKRVEVNALHLGK